MKICETCSVAIQTCPVLFIDLPHVCDPANSMAPHLRSSPEVAERIVDAIIADLTNRSGGDSWFNGCDNFMQQEIRLEWTRLVSWTISRHG